MKKPDLYDICEGTPMGCGADISNEFDDGDGQHHGVALLCLQFSSNFVQQVKKEDVRLFPLPAVSYHLQTRRIRGP